MMHVLGGVAGLAAEHPAVDPEIAGLLLGKRIEGVARSQRAQQAGDIGAAGMIALAATAIERKALAAVRGMDLAHPLGDLGDRRLPRDLFEGAVGPPPQRRGQPVLVMGIVGNPRRLVAQVALRLWIRFVAAHLDDAAVLDRDLEAAIHVAEVARRLVPLSLRHRFLRLATLELRLAAFDERADA